MVTPPFIFFRDINSSFYGKQQKGMVYMCKVYAFPVKKEIPEDLKETLQKSAKEYVKVIYNSLDCLVTEDTTEEEYIEISGMLLEAYLEAILNAVAEQE